MKNTCAQHDDDVDLSPSYETCLSAADQCPLELSWVLHVAGLQLSYRLHVAALRLSFQAYALRRCDASSHVCVRSGRLSESDVSTPQWVSGCHARRDFH
jgi:hypothetical protein